MFVELLLYVVDTLTLFMSSSFAGLRLAALAGFDVQVYDTRVEEGDEGNTYHGRRDGHDSRRGECT